MDTADRFVKEIFSWMEQGEKYADKLKKLARELEFDRESSKHSAITAAFTHYGDSVASQFPPVATVSLDAPSTAARGISEKRLNEAQDILKTSNETVTSIKKLFEELKNENLNSNPDPEDLEKLHRLILADVLMAVGRHGKLDMSNIDQLSERLIKFLPELGFSHILTNVYDVLITFSLETGSESFQILARSSDMEASGGIKLAGPMAYFLPEAIDSWSDQIRNNHVTEASRSLRSRAEQILEITRKLRKQFSIIEKSLKYLFRVKDIIEKKNRNQDEKKELIDYAIKYSHDPVVKQWLRDNAESDDFFHLVDLAHLIQQNLKGELARKEAREGEAGEEGKKEKRKKKDRKSEKIELIFLAHGSIENQMIPARCLLPLMSITDVLLYSPWNCFLSATAAYGIAKGSIQPDADPDHRKFVCRPPTNPKEQEQKLYTCPYTPEEHTPPNLPRHWNSMRSSGTSNIPKIMVSPVGKPGDRAFVCFITLEIYLGEPAANRYLIPYLTSWTGKVPFFVVTLAISLVLSFYEYEATVHLAACLGKSSREAVMQEEELRQQYAYAVDNTRMTVPIETIATNLRHVFDMFRAVFGD